jgi:hypothetical protein
MKPEKLIAGLFLLCALVAVAAPAGQDENHPGYFPIDRFGILSDDSLSLEINLNRALLQLVAAALGNEEPEFAELVGALDSIRVRVAEADSFDVEAVHNGLNEAAEWLENRDWSTMLRLREDGERIYVYTRLNGGEMQGIAILAIEDDGEAVMVNVVGSLDPERLAALAEALDIPQLGLAAGLGGSRGGDEDDDGDDEENRP